MERNAIKSDFRSSKMAAGSHFVEKKLCIDLKWWEMQSKVIFGYPKWPPAAILKKKSCVLIWNGEKCDQKWFSVIQNGRWQPFCEKKSCVLIWNGEKCDQKWFSDFQMVAGSHFEKKISKKSFVLIWNGEKCTWKWFSVIQNGRWQPVSEKKVEYWSEMARNAIESDFRTSKMAAGSHFVEKS